MPNLKKLKEEGTYGNLESTIPPITDPAWVSFATGKNPGKHGCYDFVWADKSLKRLRSINSKNIKGYKASKKSRCPHQHGWERQGYLQCFYGAPLAQPQVRKSISQRIHQPQGSPKGDKPLY